MVSRILSRQGACSDRLRPSDSSYDRLIKNIKQSTLPSFLQVKSREIANILEKKRFSQSLIHKRVMEESKTQDKKENRVMLSVRGRKLHKQELVQLKNSGPLTKNIMDACLSLLKAMNSQLINQNECHDRVMIANTDFSNNVFNKSFRKKAISSVNVLKYDYLVFPIEDENWSLMIVNLREQRVRYLNPCRRTTNLKNKQLSLLSFLKEELLYHENRRIEDSEWRHVQFEKTHQTHVKEADSGIYILKEIEYVCLARPQQFQQNSISEYRLEFLQLLYLNKDNIKN